MRAMRRTYLWVRGGVELAGSACETRLKERCITTNKCLRIVKAAYNNPHHESKQHKTSQA